MLVPSSTRIGIVVVVLSSPATTTQSLGFTVRLKEHFERVDERPLEDLAGAPLPILGEVHRKLLHGHGDRGLSRAPLLDLGAQQGPFGSRRREGRVRTPHEGFQALATRGPLTIMLAAKSPILSRVAGRAAPPRWVEPPVVREPGP